MIYLDQAATSFPKPPEVVDAVVKTMQTVGNSGRGAHGASLAASRLVFEARTEVANFFGGVDPSHIAFTANATESLNLALFGLLGPGDHVITTAWEHNSVLRPLYHLEKQGLELSIIPCNDLGELDLTELNSLLRPNTKAMVCNHASNVTGNIIDLTLISDFCQEHNLFLIVDGAQSAGTIPINLVSLGIDVFCFTGHKSLCGPQGVGGVYLRSGLEIRPFKMGGSGTNSFSHVHPQKMPEALEAGTLNTPGIAGLLAGVRFLQKQGLDNINKVEQGMTEHFYRETKKLKSIKIYGDFQDSNRCPIVSLNIAELDSSFVSQILAEQYGIYTRAGAHCAPLIHKALGTKERGMVRFSFSHLNTIAEIDRTLEALAFICHTYGR